MATVLRRAGVGFCQAVARAQRHFRQKGEDSDADGDLDRAATGIQPVPDRLANSHNDHTAHQIRPEREQWLRRGATAVLKVPSPIVSEEWNFLINPLHADFKALAFGRTQRYELDGVLARTRRGP